MSYTSGDWTARQRYLLSSTLCFPGEDEQALLEFINGTCPKNDSSGCCIDPPPMPFFPVFNGPPANMQFATIRYVYSSYNVSLCSVTLTTTGPGRIAIWGTIDASGTNVPLQLMLDRSVLTQSTFSPYLFYGSSTPIPAGTYTASLQCLSMTEIQINTASIMAIGLLS